MKPAQKRRGSSNSSLSHVKVTIQVAAASHLPAAGGGLAVTPPPREPRLRMVMLTAHRHRLTHREYVQMQENSSVSHGLQVRVLHLKDRL